MKPIRVAIVGCGAISKTHVRAIQSFPTATITALVAPSGTSSNDLADKIQNENCPRPGTFTTLTEALRADNFDLAVITTPSGLHVELGMQALSAGKHVVIEKPVDTDLSRAKKLEAAAVQAASRGIVASVISQHRFDPASMVVSQATKQGRFGRLASAVASVPWWRSQRYYDSQEWRGTWGTDGGGAFMNQGVHTVDLLLSYFGRPIEIYARTALLAHERIEVEDTAVATVTFANGAVAVLHATTAAYPGLPTRIQIMGSQGSAVIENDRLAYFHCADGTPTAPDMGLLGDENRAARELAEDHMIGASGQDPTVDASGHIRQYDDVIRAIKNGGEPTVTVSDAVMALITIRGIYVSATLNHPVLYGDIAAGKYSGVDVRPGVPGRGSM
ncbi:oxidoreductase [Pseudarthrobacter sulfonivorans]|uniref:Oxidoreductase n=1 Tax=Pseudarthrobacter sulfonivorans TaxID=121292 RepID=A0A0U3Q880_9MICC|nr:Gfo/Idh/MocA family oxidoreductase [Pseudarthrobacter sulfonivorans]ALV41434.1 oxidoreductase [Pseudarthrobacter sulfonivorans]